MRAWQKSDMYEKRVVSDSLVVMLAVAHILFRWIQWRVFAQLGAPLACGNARVCTLVHYYHGSLSSFVFSQHHQTSVIKLVVGTLRFGFEKWALDEVEENVEGGRDMIGWWAHV